MTSYEAPKSPPPSAWVWSEYRGEKLGDAASDDASTTGTSLPKSVMVGAGLATAVVALTGLTWLFSNQPASAPAPQPPAASAKAPSAPMEVPSASMAAPAAAAPSPVETTPPAPAAEAPPAPASSEPPATEAPRVIKHHSSPSHSHRGKKKKHRG